MFARLRSLFAREEQQAKADLSAIVQRVRAKVVTDADVVFVSVKDSTAYQKETISRALKDIAPEIKFIVHDEAVKVSAVIKKLEDKVKAKVSRAKKK